MILLIATIIIRDGLMLIIKIIMNITSYYTFKSYQAKKRAAVRQATDQNKSKKDKSLKKSLILAIIMCFISIGIHTLSSVVTYLHYLDIFYAAKILLLFFF